MYLQKYVSAPWFTSLMNGIPIDLLDQVREHFRMHGMRVRIKYRGPRNTPADIGRGKLARQGTCLKQNAKTFAVYLSFK